MKKLIVAAIMVFAVAALLMVTATPSEAVHAGSQELTCGQCHTMHSSQGDSFGAGEMGNADGSSLLLRIGGTKRVTDLCLSCHAENGSVGATTQQFNSGAWLTTPPKVLVTGAVWTSVSNDFATIGAGGDFSGILGEAGGIYTPGGQDAGSVSIGYGHSVNNTAVVTPPGVNGAVSFAIGAFSCTSCHDPHGVTATTADINLFRNLKSGLGATDAIANWTALPTGDLATSYVGGVADSAEFGTAIAATSNIWPVYNGSNTFQNAYLMGAAATDNISMFCAQCHGQWHELVAGNTNGSEVGQTDWRRHPVQAQIVDVTGGIDLLSVSGATIADFGHYDQTYNGLAVGKKVPALQNNAGSTYFADDSGDRVFCLSCHFAHGGPNFDALRWSYQSTVSAGNQTGVSLQSDTGCQQCHNRGGTFGG